MKNTDTLIEKNAERDINRMVKIHIPIPYKIKEELKDAAKEHGLKLAPFVRMIAIKYVKQYRKDNVNAKKNE